jgi:hypothetical protein
MRGWQTYETIFCREAHHDRIRRNGGRAEWGCADIADSGPGAAVVAQPGMATALSATTQEQQGQAGMLTADEAKQSAAGNVAELQQMIRGSDLSELRTTSNGNYGASLLFYGKEMTYYVALFQ